MRTSALLALSLISSVAAAQPKVKPPIRGLVSMGAYAFVPQFGSAVNDLGPVREKAGLLQGIVIVANWRDLEPTPGTLASNNQIDQGLAEVRKYNKEHPDAPLAVKLRVFGGYWAPDWVAKRSGGWIPVVHTNNQGGEKDRQIGHVWAPAYRNAWAELQRKLAAKYDGDPVIHEVAVTSCMMFTAEPFSIDTSPGALQPLRDAGLTDAKYKQCLDGIVADYAPWKTTRFQTSLNPFKDTDGKQPQHDLAFTEGWMKRCHKAQPERCAFDNHNLDKDGMNKDLDSLYAAMRDSGAEVGFQSGPTMPKDLPGTIKLAVDSGATSVELWQEYKGFREMTDAQLKRFAKMLIDNR